MNDSYTTPPPPPVSGDAQAEDRNIAMLTHISGIILGFIVPLIIWLVNKDKADKGWLVAQAKEALNFQISVSLAAVLCVLLMVVVIGFPLLALVSIGALVLTIIAGIKANEGQAYRYPFSWRLLK